MQGNDAPSTAFVNLPSPANVNIFTHQDDWDSELDVPFYDHVFLENHLNKEHLKCKPLASFLELVCTGLSKNPYFSVDDKKQHLEWFTQFFDDKITRINDSIKEDHMANVEKISRGTST
ncbi:unnamed protein product [Schistosoma margrebowiei]|uniref:Small ribosomal subunit protein mS31 n=1 Tax=Schistosoma margrebowiei TaxID=48269 RepID=A0A183LI70_9TREM|nr:unnamed protein product [Schistosoma margrebowiei]